MTNFKKDQQGLYYRGELKATSYIGALKEVYQLQEIPDGFCVNDSYAAKDYSVIDKNGVQHIYDLSPASFYNSLMKLE